MPEARPRPKISALRGKSDDSTAGTVQSFQRGSTILDLIITANRPLRLAEIARTIVVDKASAFRFLGDTGALRPGCEGRRNQELHGRRQLLHWSVSIGRDGGIMAVVRPHLERLVAETNESGHFAILSNASALLLDYIGSKGTIVAQIALACSNRCTAPRWARRCWPFSHPIGSRASSMN